MLSRLAAATLAAVLLVTPAAFAQEEEVYERIENIHGDADGFFELYSLIRDAIMFGDPVTIAQYAFYPLTVNANGEVYDVLEEQDLIDNFDSLVSENTREAVLNQDIADMVVTSEGIGLGNGSFWISNVCLDDACEETQWGILSINN